MISAIKNIVLSVPFLKYIDTRKFKTIECDRRKVRETAKETGGSSSVVKESFGHV